MAGYCCWGYSAGSGYSSGLSAGLSFLLDCCETHDHAGVYIQGDAQ